MPEELDVNNFEVPITTEQAGAVEPQVGVDGGLANGARPSDNCGTVIAPVSFVQEDKLPIRDSNADVGRSSLALNLLILLFCGSLAFGVLTDTISNTPFWSSPDKIVEFVMGCAASGLLTVYVLMGARWARISCYILSTFILLGVGLSLFEGKTLLTIFGQGGTASFVFLLLGLICFIAGSVVLLVSNTDEMFKSSKSTGASKSVCAVCLVLGVLFVSIVFADAILRFALEDADESPANEISLEAEEPVISLDDDEKMYMAHGAIRWAVSDVANGALKHSASVEKTFVLLLKTSFKELLEHGRGIAVCIISIIVAILKWLTERIRDNDGSDKG